MNDSIKSENQAIMDSIWKQTVDLDQFNAIGKNTLAESLGIEFVDWGPRFLVARMPVDHRTIQPAGILNGGANLALAETLGSAASVLCLEDPESKVVFGIEINANHLQTASSGWVYGKLSPIRIGKKLHVWQIEIKDEDSRLTCISRLTVLVDKKRK